MALTLARPEGNPPGGRGLALFYVETRDDGGRAQRHRDQPPQGQARHAQGPDRGAHARRRARDARWPAPPTACATSRRCSTSPAPGTRSPPPRACGAASRSRATTRAGAWRSARRSSDKPLHLETLADIQAEYEAAFHLAFRAVELLGREEAGELAPREAVLLRLITPLAKLTTARRRWRRRARSSRASAAPATSRTPGCRGCCATRRCCRSGRGRPTCSRSTCSRPPCATARSTRSTKTRRRWRRRPTDADLAAAARTALGAIEHARTWVGRTAARAPAALEAGARRFALTLARALSLALLARHAQWSRDHERDDRAAAAAIRFARHGVDLPRQRRRRRRQRRPARRGRGAGQRHAARAA